jgi:hypothetical protein
MGSDIISHIIAIGLFYHKINIACKKMSFIHFRFSDILFSLYVRYFKFIKAGLTMFRSNFTANTIAILCDIISQPIVKNKMTEKKKWLVYHKNIIINVTSCGRPRANHDKCKKIKWC